MSLPRVAVVTTGGTIDSLGADRLDLAAYLETGRRLEPGELLRSVAPELATIAHVTEVPPSLPEGTPARLVTIIESCLAKDPRDRPASAGAIHRALSSPSESAGVG